jgi:hypothetical protein
MNRAVETPKAKARSPKQLPSRSDRDKAVPIIGDIEAPRRRVGRRLVVVLQDKIRKANEGWGKRRTRREAGLESWGVFGARGCRTVSMTNRARAREAAPRNL